MHTFDASTSHSHSHFNRQPSFQGSLEQAQEAQHLQGPMSRGCGGSSTRQQSARDLHVSRVHSSNQTHEPVTLLNMYTCHRVDHRSATGIQLGRFLGRGAVASVYEGCFHGVPLAVKVAHQSTEPLPEEYGPEEAEEKLLHEVAVYSKLARIQGTFVPRLVAHGTLMSDAGEPFPFLATTRVGRGRPLYVAAAEARLGPAQLAAVARNAMAAIAAVHRQGVAHCDVHSPNVLLDDDGSVKLVGFSDAELQLSQPPSQSHADACNGDLADMRGTLCEMVEECLNVDCQQAWALLRGWLSEG